MENIEALLEHDELLDSTRGNIRNFLSCESLPDWAKNSIVELIDAKEYAELNNRFFRTLKFGTGGMRGRTVGCIISPSERGLSKSAAPEHASMGSAYINDFSVTKAIVALFKYCKKFLKCKSQPYEQKPSLVISYDTRFFSKHFAELCASTWVKLGGHGMMFDGPRSTPQLSFSVRHLHATAGVMITASHNPWHDNGFKAYFSDGAQMVDPHASMVIDEYDALGIPYVSTCLSMNKDLSNVYILEKNVDDAYLDGVRNTIIYPYYESYNLSAVFTPLHGVGAISSVPLLNGYNGLKYYVVDEQNDCDSMFSTVKSPNPENKEALKLAVDRAKAVSADIVLATDPDGDRAALSAKNRDDKFEYFSGNVAWSMLLEYRLSKLFEFGILNPENSRNAAVVKTFVTTPLIAKIAKNYGIKCVNTLTGFKWIGEKIADYEDILHHKLSLNGVVINYDATRSDARRELLLEHSTFFVFGCEESYGCLASDIVRDKDANSAVLMLCELAEHAKIRGLTPCDLRDEMFIKYGYFGESVLNIYYDGADGAVKISNILASYRSERPSSINGTIVSKFTDFLTDDIFDCDGKRIAKQDFFFIELENGCKYAVRASGTEPKVKFYMFCEAHVKDETDLPRVKQESDSLLEGMKNFLTQDADCRSQLKA